MKKIILTVAVFSALVMSSCGGERTAKDEAADLSAKIENCSNPDSIQVYVKQAQDYASKLLAEGKTKEAQEYLDKVTPAIEKKDPTVKEAFSNLMTATSNAVADKATEIKESVDSTAGAVADKASDAVANAKEAVADKAEEVKEAGAKAVDDAKSKAADMLQKGADKLNGK
ncbi:MAG: hypothetical protein NC127_05420 [Muribaculum sp.]|nr:hypothetical protein [Muribaculum sp.]